jgi:IMP cyclohydrolase
MYVGRIVAVGRTQTGANAAMYRVSSRSFPHRRTICREGCVVVVPREGHGPECKRNPYTTYTCLRIARNWAIIANGSHTDPIAERIDAGTAVRDALVTTLLALDYENIANLQHPVTLQPTGLSVKHSAREKSRMLATEARG